MKKITKRILTTGDVAKACAVAPRTVSKWIDGKKLKGYRLPGSHDRRVLRTELVKFMKTAGMDASMVEDDDRFHILAVGCGELTLAAIRSAIPEVDLRLAVTPEMFEAGVEIAKEAPHLLLLDGSLGLSAIIGVREKLVAMESPVLVAAIGEFSADGVSTLTNADVLTFDFPPTPTFTDMLPTLLAAARGDA